MTVAAFMDLALYDPTFGYYARAGQRSGRAGDFFTSVDVGPLFGVLLERQLLEMSSFVGGAALISSRQALATAGSRPTSSTRRGRAILPSTIASGCIWSKRAQRRGPPIVRSLQRASIA